MNLRRDQNTFVMAAQDTQVNLILQNWKPTKNGNFPVVVKVYHNRKRRYFRTGVSVHSKHWDDDTSQIIGKARENKLVQKLLVKARELVQQIETLHDEFNFDLFSKDFSESSPLQSGENFVTFWESVIRDLRKENRNGTADSYEDAMNKFKKFVKGKSLPIRHITQLTFEKFRIFMVQSGQSTNGAGIYLRSMSAVYGRALARKLVKPETDPRDGFKIKTTKTPKKAIKREEVHLLAGLDLNLFSLMEESRDLFLFSYYCQGMNLKDLSLLSWDQNIVEDRIYYKRGKTADLFTIHIKPQTIGAILEKQRLILDQKLKDNAIQNKLAKNLVFRIFDQLTDAQMKNPDELKKVRKQRGKVLNAHLRKLAKCHLGFGPAQLKYLTYYAARHTYATVLKSQHAPVTLISEALGHADIRTTQVYLDSFANQELDKFNDLL